MDEVRESDPFGTLISIITLREHEIGKLRKKINELQNRLTKIKLDIEEEKRKELELLNEASDNLKKESELRSRIASLNASIELAIKLKSDHMKRIEKEKSDLNERRRRHDAIITEKRNLWAKYEEVYESLSGAKEVRKEKCALKLLEFTFIMKKAELQQLVKEHDLLEEIQENIVIKVSSKIENAEKENTELVSRIEDQENRIRYKRDENEKLKIELEKLKNQHLPLNLLSRMSNSNIFSSSRGLMERESLGEEIAEKSRTENIDKKKESNNNCFQNSFSSQDSSDSKSILTSSFLQIKNFSSSLFSFSSLENINSVRPRKRIEEVDETSKKLMLQLEENKKALIEKRQTDLRRLSNESNVSSSKSNSNRELNRNCDEVSSNISQDKHQQAEKRSNICMQTPSQKNDPEMDAQMELMPPPASVALQMNGTTNYFPQSQSSDFGYHTQTQSTFVESQDESRKKNPYTHTMYSSQTSQVSQIPSMDYRRNNRPTPMNLQTEEDNNQYHFKVEPEPMEQSQPDQTLEANYNASQTSALNFGKEMQRNFASPPEPEDTVAQKNRGINDAAFKQQTMEKEMMGSTYDHGEANYVVESEYFSSKKYGQMNKTLDRRSHQNMTSFEQMDIAMQNEDRAQSPDMAFMMSPISSPMPEGLISPPPPPSSDAIGNISGFGFQMKSVDSNQKSAGFSFNANKSATSSGGAIFRMF